eukprot:gene27146-32792_t
MVNSSPSSPVSGNNQQSSLPPPSLDDLVIRPTTSLRSKDAQNVLNTQKFKIRPSKSFATGLKLREDLVAEVDAPLSVNLKTKQSTLRYVIDPKPHKYLYNDSETSSEAFPQSQAGGGKGGEVFHFDLHSSIRSSAPNNDKVSLINGLNNLRKFKFGTSPSAKLKKLDEHFQRTVIPVNPLYEQPSVEDYEEIAPQLRSYKSGVTIGVPNSPNPHTSVPKRLALKIDPNKALALSTPAPNAAPFVHEVFRQLAPLDIHSADGRSYPPSSTPLAATLRVPPMIPLDPPPPLLNVFGDDPGMEESVSVDSYRENEREGFLQHNIRSIYQEESLRLSESGDILDAQLTEEAGSATTSRGGSRAGAGVVARKKKYTHDAQDFPPRAASPLSRGSAGFGGEADKKIVHVRPPSPKLTSDPRAAHVVDLNPPSDPILHVSQSLPSLSTASTTPQASHLPSDPAPALANLMHCVTCYGVGALYCTQCCRVYCLPCWNNVPHHPLYSSVPPVRVKSRGAAEGSSPRKSYSQGVLFGTYQQEKEASSRPKTGNQAPAPIPHDFAAHPLRTPYTKVYLEKDGSVRLGGGEGGLGGVVNDSPSRPSSRPRSRAKSPPRPASSSNSHEQAHLFEEQEAPVEPHFHYATPSNHGFPTIRSPPGSRGRAGPPDAVVRASSRGNSGGRGKRPTSPAFAASAGGGVNFAYSQKPATTSAPLRGIAMPFQPVDWREGLFQAKDPLGVLNKHAVFDEEEEGLKTKVFGGITVHVKGSRKL